MIPALLFVSSLALAAETGSGIVTETIDAGGYVYLKLADPDRWIATQPFQVSRGDRVSFSGGSEMTNFHSKTLDRTFESIIFVQEVSTGEISTESSPVAMMENHQKKKSMIAAPSTIPVPAAGEIPPLDEGKTIAVILSEASQLNDQTITLRARVMKVSRNILGKNWITLQDGTGTEPDNKLMVTSSEMATPGDLIVVTGILKKDIDIGAGYQYKVLLEDATFSANSENS
jgi:hypothetical protein